MIQFREKNFVPFFQIKYEYIKYIHVTCVELWFVFFSRIKTHSLHSLRRKRFRLVSEQRKTGERDSRLWPRETRSPFFAPKPHGNACYAGYRVFKIFARGQKTVDTRLNEKE